MTPAPHLRHVAIDTRKTLIGGPANDGKQSYNQTTSTTLARRSADSADRTLPSIPYPPPHCTTEHLLPLPLLPSKHSRSKGSKMTGRHSISITTATSPHSARQHHRLENPDSLIADASQLCVAKRTDCVLVVDEDEHLRGIFTAKDLAFRVIGDGMDPHTTPVSAIMTRNPMVTIDTTSATKALTTMVTRGFRHLPVCNDEGDVIGLLDITKVFHESLEKLERACCSLQKLYNPIEGVQSEFGNGTRGATPGAVNPLMVYVEALRNKISFPNLGLILDARTSAATVGVKTSVKEAAILMREHHTTAVCVMENDGRRIAGIFTSKDIVLCVIAAGLDARTCSVVRVMTSPETALPSLSILCAKCVSLSAL
ncbi:hypothetical protein PtA15_12A567 [Puccinia triticina]|uniref:CBS domain-containing protein n=1 Tax=Puccinia triticina TaxID=208348 RepID=A0ABY7D1K7_9BASI|nr:uncharacterized protein PtA15_12A567 [Puccinia triticina]WAQ90577.1 hypothetical protein PtA15_12A567 [Puccinia triticina]WAR61890.1 hypothetical protein PtB15_12B582 [Puccinia triticina]